MLAKTMPMAAKFALNAYLDYTSDLILPEGQNMPHATCQMANAEMPNI